MTLTIRKKGNKNFWHYYNNFEYSASDLIAVFDGNYMKIRSEQGRIIFLRDGFLFSDITLYDDSVVGGAETFTSIIALEERLIYLGYPAFYADSEGFADWGAIGGVITNQTDLVDYISNIAQPTQTSELINDGDDAVNPFISGVDWGDVEGAITDQTDLINYINLLEIDGGTA
jgi:hypothetical protein